MVHVGSKFWYVVLVVPETTKPLTTFRKLEHDQGFNSLLSCLDVRGCVGVSAYSSANMRPRFSVGILSGRGVGCLTTLLPYQCLMLNSHALLAYSPNRAAYTLLTIVRYGISNRECSRQINTLTQSLFFPSISIE